MTSIQILEHLAFEFSSSAEQVRGVLDMLDAGLEAAYISRFRRSECANLSEVQVRRLQRMREELIELDRRRATILRLLEGNPSVTDADREGIAACMDRFELEDLFIPHRRPEPEVQLAIDRGLDRLADELVAPVAGQPEEAEAAHSGDEDEDVSEVQPAEANAEHATVPIDEAASELEAAAPQNELESAQPGGESDSVAKEEEHADTVAQAEVNGEPAHAERHAEREEGEGDDKERTNVQPAPVHTAARIELNLELARLCSAYVRPDRGIHTEMDALTGAVRILADRLGRNARLRGTIRRLLRKHGILSVRAAVPEGKLGRHKALLKTKQSLRQIQGRQLLALRQAQKERVLTTTVSLDRNKALPKVRAALGKRTHPAFESVLREVSRQALDYRLLPVVEADVRLELKERADEEALHFLAQHLRHVLLAATLGRKPVAGLDVNAKGDWTIALLDAESALQGPCARIETAGKEVADLGKELAAVLGDGRTQVIAVGHGRGSRAAIPVLRRALKSSGLDVAVHIVNEAGVPNYATSPLAREELPECTVPQRQAVSLGRRLQDPLVEILKFDPRHLGLGPEQGLVTKASLKRVFTETIESCVAYVGCDVNRAPAVFLEAMPGLDKQTVDRLVARRNQQPFESREELRSDGLLSEAQWTSCASFLRVSRARERLDSTHFHPYQYDLVRRIVESTGFSVEDGLGRPGINQGLRRDDFGVDEGTWRDVMREIAYPGRDPRPRVWLPELLDPDADEAVLIPGRTCSGIISNVASFGAFVDIGLPGDAMIHISEISDRYLRDARERLYVGQVVRVRILAKSGNRLSVSMKNVAPVEHRDHREHRGERRDRPDRRREAPNVRAAQSRRDGRAGREGSGEGRGRRGGERSGARGGQGGGQGGGFGQQGAGRRPGGGQRDRRGGRGREDELVTQADLEAAGTGGAAYTPFATFFKQSGIQPETDAASKPSE